MGYKTITICLNEISANSRLLEVARKLGAQFGAHIKGLYVIPGVQVFGDGLAGSVAPIIVDANRIYFERALPKVKQAFETIAKEDGLNFDFQVVDSSLPEIAPEVIANARMSDLIVVPGRDMKDIGSLDKDFVAHVVMGIGRPVLVVPGKTDAIFSTDDVLFGWDSSREAARAAFDALPFLKMAKQLRVVSIDSPLDGTVPGASLAEVLDRHGVKTELIKVASDGLGAGEALLRAAKDFGCGLIVMGCYGHGRFSEFVFGGATRHVLANLDRPVLLSH